MVKAIDIALTGLNSAATRLRASALNITNAQTSGSLDSSGRAPYTPLTTVSREITDGEGGGLGVLTNLAARENPAPFVPAYDPDSPFANEDGLIAVPNINLAEESVNALLAKYEYKANLGVIKTADEMTDELLDLFDEKV